jgi:hypothetical protein
VLTSTTHAVSMGRVVLFQSSSQAGPLQSFPEMDQPNYQAMNRHKWLATSPHTSPLPAPRHLHHRSKIYQGRSHG